MFLLLFFICIINSLPYGIESYIHDWGMVPINIRITDS